MSEDEKPVTQAECRLRHALVEQRFDTLERDMREVKQDVAETKTLVVNMSDNQGLMLKVLVLVLVLVLAGRGLDLSALIGGI